MGRRKDEQRDSRLSVSSSRYLVGVPGVDFLCVWSVVGQVCVRGGVGRVSSFGRFGVEFQVGFSSTFSFNFFLLLLRSILAFIFH